MEDMYIENYDFFIQIVFKGGPVGKMQFGKFEQFSEKCSSCKDAYDMHQNMLYPMCTLFYILIFSRYFLN